MTSERRALGMAGEELATSWYQRRGYDILARNWRCRQGELDLVVRTGATVVFCEVKSRSSLRFGSPFEAVTSDKRRRLRALAAAWLRESGTRAGEIRFDVAGVLDGEVEVVEAAF
ncbi:MAG: YraN family protein [Actinomycetota bacterium]|nr:YraN family protein [Actinomycetota bacterium]